MQTTPTTFTIAEFCTQLEQKTIRINHDYQRTSAVWPTSARSFLIDTVLNGYPMPKLILWQKLDIKKREVSKEVVDGQQRSHALLDFFQNRFKLTGVTEFSGCKFADLDEELQAEFLEYPLSVDLLVGVGDAEVRQVFYRMNSYTSALNAQEQRHAKFQGDMKWFVLKLAQTYAESLASAGVLTKRQLARMTDSQWIAELVYALLNGIETYSKKNLDLMYRDEDENFQRAKGIKQRIDEAVGQLVEWELLHGTPLLKSRNAYTLVLAISHTRRPVSELQRVYKVARGRKISSEDVVLANLARLADEISEPRTKKLEPFVEACSEGTNTQKNRRTRFKWMCKALLPKPL